MKEFNPNTGIFIIPGLVIALFVLVAAARRAWQYYDTAFPKLTIHEHERGVRYVRGKLVGTVEPGQFRYRASTHEISVVDMREHLILVPAQEVLSADALGFKLSLQAHYRIEDPVKALTVVSSYGTTLYADVHSAARSVAEVLTGEEILAQRGGIGSQVEALVKSSAERYGVAVRSITIRDCMLPGNLKQIYSKVAEAKQEGLAALERARGESAALRNLANASRTLQSNPNLGFLRLIQTLEKNGGNSLCLIPPDLLKLVHDGVPDQKRPESDANSSDS